MSAVLCVFGEIITLVYDPCFIGGEGEYDVCGLIEYCLFVSEVAIQLSTTSKYDVLTLEICFPNSLQQD